MEKAPSTTEVMQAISMLASEFAEKEYRTIESVLEKCANHGGEETERAIVLLAALSQL